MKILHINKFFDLNGGTEAYVHGLIQRQQAAGHEIRVLSTRSEKNLSVPQGSHLVQRNDLRDLRGVIEPARKASSFLWNREARREMEALLDEFRPDIVHLHNLYHHLSSSVLGPIRSRHIPCVQTLHDLKLACPNYRMFTEGSVCERCKGGRYFEAVKHHCLTASTLPNVLAALEMGMTKLFQSYERTVQCFICPSQFMSDKMSAWGEPQSKMRVVPNPADVSEVRATLDGEYLLYVGRLSFEKGVDTLIKALAALPETKLHIAGIGPQEAELRVLVASLKLQNVNFLGFLRKEEIRAAHRHAKALLVPSIVYENASIAALDAMGDGLPIVASRIGGLPELVEPGVNGWLVDPQNVEAWSRTLKEVWETPLASLKEKGKQSHEKVVSRHAWPVHLAGLDKIYAEALAGRA
jgi:glycosyltransferase involved in cell wall biosynthesis